MSKVDKPEEAVVKDPESKSTEDQTVTDINENKSVVAIKDVDCVEQIKVPDPTEDLAQYIKHPLQHK